MNKEVVMWPDNDEDEDDDEIWALSVDGVHCWIQEPRHPEWSQDRKHYSHKCGHAGVSASERLAKCVDHHCQDPLPPSKIELPRLRRIAEAKNIWNRGKLS